MKDARTVTRVRPLESWGRDPNVLDTVSLSNYLGMSEQVTRQMIRRKQIPGRKVGKDWYVYLPAVMRALAGAAPQLTSEEIVGPLTDEGDTNILKVKDMAVRWGISGRAIRRSALNGQIPALALGPKVTLFFYPACIRWLAGQTPLILDTDVDHSIRTGTSAADRIAATVLARRWKVFPLTITNATKNGIMPAIRGKRTWTFSYRVCVERLAPDSGNFSQPSAASQAPETAMTSAERPNSGSASSPPTDSTCQRCSGPRQPHYDHVHYVDQLPQSPHIAEHDAVRGYALVYSGTAGLPPTWVFFTELATARLFGQSALTSVDITDYDIFDAARDTRPDAAGEATATWLYIRRDASLRDAQTAETRSASEA